MKKFEFDGFRDHGMLRKEAAILNQATYCNNKISHLSRNIKLSKALERTALDTQSRPKANIGDTVRGRWVEIQEQAFSFGFNGLIFLSIFFIRGFI